MNILQILPQLNVGGVETGTIDLSRYLVKSGHKAVVVSGGGDLVKELEGIGAIHYQLPVHKKSIFTMAKMVPKLVEIIRKEEIDIIHARSRVPAWIAYFSARITDRPFITTCHGYYTKHLFSYVMGWSKRVIVLSNVIARHMIDDFAVPRERIRLIPRSVDLTRFKYVDPTEKRTEEFNIGIIGRITPIKGHIHFIKAMARVARVKPRIKIWIVGDASKAHQAYKEQIKVLVKRLGLWHCTDFLGTQRNIPEVLSHLDLLVLSTTTHEAFGRVIVEAQASGVPVVATEVGGVIDIIKNEETGLLVPAADPQGMASAVLRILQDKELATKLSQNAYNRVKEKYNLELMANSTIEAYKDALSNFKILIVKLSSLGDVVLSTAAMRAIRERFGNNYKIGFLVGEEAKDVVLRCPYIDELIVADFRGKDKGIKGFLKLSHILRKKNFDMVIDLQNNRLSHMLSFLTLANRRYGYNNKKFGFLLNKSIPNENLELSAVEHQFNILKMLEIELKNPYLELWPSQEDERYIENFINSEWLSSRQKLVGINISASKRWLTKCWPRENIIRLCEELGKMDIRTIITGTESDFSQASFLIASVKNAKVINACGKTSINQLACLIKRCACYISGDSFPLHVAAAVKTPFVALFGPTDPSRHLPPADNYILIRKEIDCSPCYKSKCNKRKCMQLISPEEVLSALKRLLDK